MSVSKRPELDRRGYETLESFGDSSAITVWPAVPWWLTTALTEERVYCRRVMTPGIVAAVVAAAVAAVVVGVGVAAAAGSAAWHPDFLSLLRPNRPYPLSDLGRSPRKGVAEVRLLQNALDVIKRAED